MDKIQSYRDLIVWQKAMVVVTLIYALTEKYPQEERYALVRETRRSVISIPSNIAEGKYRGSRKDFAKFLNIAFSSGAELETQIEIAIRVGIIVPEEVKEVQFVLTISYYLKPIT